MNQTQELHAAKMRQRAIAVKEALVAERDTRRRAEREEADRRRAERAGVQAAGPRLYTVPPQTPVVPTPSPTFRRRSNAWKARRRDYLAGAGRDERK